MFSISEYRSVFPLQGSKYGRETKMKRTLNVRQNLKEFARVVRLAILLTIIEVVAAAAHAQAPALTLGAKIASIERCMKFDRCKAKLSTYTTRDEIEIIAPDYTGKHRLSGKALNVRGPSGEQLKCVMLEFRDRKSLGVVVGEYVPGSIVRTRNVFVGVDLEGRVVGMLIDGLTRRIDANDERFHYNLALRLNAAIAGINACGFLVPDEDKKWALSVTIRR